MNCNNFNSSSVYGSPLPSQGWPQSRGIPRILNLHKGPKEWGDRADLSKIIADLPYGAWAADIGTGSGKVPQHIGSIRSDLHWALVSATELDPPLLSDMIDRGSSIYYCFVPADLQLLKDHYNEISLLLETYGAVTYDNNPDLVLLLYALLLAQGGTASIMLSTTNDKEPTHVFTHDETLRKLADFLNDRLGVNLEWCTKKIDSQAKPGTFCTDFIFRMTAYKAKEKTVNPLELFSELSIALREVIGIPQIKEKPWYSSGGFQIVAKEYIK